MGRLILVGRIAAAHGLRGLVKLQSFTGEPAAIGRYGPLLDAAGKRRFEVTVQNLVKGGVVVVEEGEIRNVVEGKGLLVRPSYDQKVEDFIRPLFQQYYTMSFDNYPVEMERIERPEVLPCKG